MKLIRVSTKMDITIHEFPEGGFSKENEVLHGLIGNECRMYQCVYPRRLYLQLHHSARATGSPGEAVSMLVDEEGLLKEHPVLNPIASYLYETDKHGFPIAGNALFVGEVDTGDGISFCGIEDNVLERLQAQLEGIANEMKKRLGRTGPEKSPDRKPEQKGPRL